MLKAVIFDMDGVIVDTEPGYLIAMNEFLAQYDKSITLEIHERVRGFAPYRTWAMILETVGLTGKVSPKDAYWGMEKFRRERLNREGYHLVPGVRKLIEELHGEGIKIAVASSSPTAEILRVLDSVNLREFITTQVSGMEECEDSKPSPEIFLKAAEHLNLDPKECLVVDDSPPGIVAAVRAGMPSIRFWNSSKPVTEDKADLTVRSLETVNVDVCRQIVRDFG